MLEEAKKEIIESIETDKISVHQVHGLIGEMLKALEKSKIATSEASGCGNCGYYC